MTVKRTPRADGPVTKYFTRGMPVALLDRLRVWAKTHRTTIEDALNFAVEIGLDRLERNAKKKS